MIRVVFGCILLASLARFNVTPFVKPTIDAREDYENITNTIGVMDERVNDTLVDGNSPTLPTKHVRAMCVGLGRDNSSGAAVWECEWDNLSNERHSFGDIHMRCVQWRERDMCVMGFTTPTQSTTTNGEWFINGAISIIRGTFITLLVLRLNTLLFGAMG